MQQPKSKALAKSLQPPPLLMTIQATPAEVIVLQAALRHYQDYLSYDHDLHARSVPLIQHFIQRLHDQLPPRQEQIQGA